MIVEVRLWGRTIGAATQASADDVVAFQYDPAFAHSGIEVSPIVMPLSRRVHEFPTLPRNTFHGLPGLMADALPDTFGNALIDAWLARQGRTSESFGAIERLCYTGTRAMGALEFAPAMGPTHRQASSRIEVAALVELASDILSQRSGMHTQLDRDIPPDAMQDILRVGTSAGGARAKAVIAWNRATDEVRSGQVPAGDGFEHWLIKFDGVRHNRDKELDDPLGFGAVEYAYALMAKAAGITMSECRLFEEHGRRHFMTRRFDRMDRGEKLHMQSLCALAHYDFNSAGAYAYEQAFLVMRRLQLPMNAIEEQFRRMVFNIVARNQDDHVKNIAYLMDKEGGWTLAPAFDVTYAYNPSGAWTSMHQMSVNGKRDNFTRADVDACASSAMMKRGRARTIVDEVVVAVNRWPEFASAAQVADRSHARIGKSHRLAW